MVAGLAAVPRILLVSRSTFSSSFLMNGMTFSRMSSDATPGYPAPEIACMVETMTVSSPKLSWSGFNERLRMAVVQFGFATMNPSHFVRRF